MKLPSPCRTSIIPRTPRVRRASQMELQLTPNCTARSHSEESRSLGSRRPSMIRLMKARNDLAQEPRPLGRFQQVKKQVGPPRVAIRPPRLSAVMDPEVECHSKSPLVERRLALPAPDLSAKVITSEFTDSTTEHADQAPFTSNRVAGGRGWPESRSTRTGGRPTP